MINIKNELEILRQWFLEHHEYSISNAQLLKQKYDEILALLEKGSYTGMRFSNFHSYSGLHEILSLQLHRIRKIQNPEGIILTGEYNRSVKDLYRDVYSVVIVQLVNPPR